MQAQALDRVQETTTVTGTGTATLLGAVAGFQSFTVAYAANALVFYCITDTSGNWEVGIGTFTNSGLTLSRTTILASSNAGAAVSFAAGTKNVFNTVPAEVFALELATGGVSARTTTTETITSANRGQLVTFSNASPIAASIAVAGTAGFPSTWVTLLKNINNGIVTFAPAFGTINGAASIKLNRGDSAVVFNDGTNYSAIVTATARNGVAPLTDALTVAIDASLSDDFRLLATSGIGATRALGNPTNLIDGQKINVRYKQDATGGRALTFGSMWHVLGTAVTLVTTTNALALISGQYDATDNTICYSLQNSA